MKFIIFYIDPLIKIRNVPKLNFHRLEVIKIILIVVTPRQKKWQWRGVLVFLHGWQKTANLRRQQTLQLQIIGRHRLEDDGRTGPETADRRRSHQLGATSGLEQSDSLEGSRLVLVDDTEGRVDQRFRCHVYVLMNDPKSLSLLKKRRSDIPIASRLANSSESAEL